MNETWKDRKDRLSSSLTPKQQKILIEIQRFAYSYCHLYGLVFNGRLNNGFIVYAITGAIFYYCQQQQQTGKNKQIVSKKK